MTVTVTVRVTAVTLGMESEEDECNVVITSQSSDCSSAQFLVTIHNTNVVAAGQNTEY